MSDSEQSSRIPSNLTALCVPGTPACARDEPITGRRLRVRDQVGTPHRRALRFAAKDPAITSPGVGSDGDPTSDGAILEIVNPVSLEGQTIALPAVGWQARGNPPGANGYRYRGGKVGTGPCRSVRIRAGQLRARCRGAELTLTLNEAEQGTLAVGLRLGNAITYCTRFGGTVSQDVGTGQGKGLFVAKDAPAPVSCPLP
jgi:hypothetical protein